MSKIAANQYIVKDSNGIQQTIISYSADKYIDLEYVTRELENLKDKIDTYLDQISKQLNGIKNAFSIGGKDITTLAQEVAENIENNTKTIIDANIDNNIIEIKDIYNEIQKNLNEQASEKAREQAELCNGNYEVKNRNG